MKQKILPVTAAALIGVGGFFIGKNTNSSSEEGNLATDTSSEMAERESHSSSGRMAAGDEKVITKKVSPSRFSESDASQQVKQLLLGNNALDRAHKWLAFLDSLQPNEYEGVVKAMRENGISESNRAEYEQILTAWALVNPKAAIAFAETIDNPFARQTILSAWAGQDAQAAIKWAETHHTGDGANPWMVGVIKGLAFLDTNTAINLLTAMPRSQERGQAIDSVLPALLEQGNDMAISWIDSLSEPALKDGATLRLSELLMRKDPVKAADFLLTHPSEASQRNMDDAFNAIAKLDQNQALNKYSMLPAGQERSNALRGIINAAAFANPSQGEMLMSRYAADVTPRAQEQFVWHAQDKAPEIAIKYIPNVADEGRRTQMYRVTLDSWFAKNPQAATNFVRANINSLPVSVVNQFQQKTNNSVVR